MAGPGGRGKRRGEEPERLGSISRPPDAPGPAPRSCDECGTSTITQLALDLADGSPVTFVSCQECSHRAWLDAEGTEIPIDEVLSRAARKT